MSSMLLTEYSVGGLPFKNRIVLPPMCQWLSIADGTVQDYHLAHYGQRAISGTGLIIVEATAVEERGRITDKDLGAWSDDQVPGLTRLASMISQFGCVPGIQLGHAGRKAWKDGPAPVGPSAIAFSEKYPAPHELSEPEIGEVLNSFVAAARRLVASGFRLLELHAAHGYLIHQFMSPLSNKRSDAYGGSLDARLKFPLALVSAVKQAVPGDVLVTLRVSASEYDPAGYSVEDMVRACSLSKRAGAAMIHVSSGGNVPVAPAQWPGYQLGFARQVREGAGVPTIGVGRLESPELAEFSLREGYCDMVAVGREMLKDPNWPSRAARLFSDDSPVVPALRPVFDNKR